MFHHLHPRNILNTIGELLFPRSCVVCKASGSYLCMHCRSQLKAYPEVCTICNKFSKDFRICPHCKKNAHAIEHIIVGFYYNSHIKQLILHLKYHHRYDVAHFLAERLALLVAIHLGNTVNADNTLIIGVPSHRKRKWLVKGYNQSELLAKHLARIKNIPYCHLVKKTRHTQSQVQLNRNQRLKNLQHAFALVAHHQEILPSRIQHLIIVDDITTTGASLNEVAKTIKLHYPNLRIHGLVIGKK